MTQQIFTKEQFWTELDALGESEVRVKFDLKHNGDVGDKHALVVECRSLAPHERRRLVIE